LVRGARFSCTPLFIDKEQAAAHHGDPLPDRVALLFSSRSRDAEEEPGVLPAGCVTLLFSSRSGRERHRYANMRCVRVALLSSSRRLRVLDRKPRVHQVALLFSSREEVYMSPFVSRYPNPFFAHSQALGIFEQVLWFMVRAMPTPTMKVLLSASLTSE